MATKSKEVISGENGCSILTRFITRKDFTASENKISISLPISLVAAEHLNYTAVCVSSVALTTQLQVTLAAKDCESDVVSVIMYE
jgi:hypothetical protein